MNLAVLEKAANAHAMGDGLPPVEKWNPENCANTHMQILRDGTWMHEGSPIGRVALVRLFSTILRKDADGQTWLVTPVEKVRVQVDVAHFIAGVVDRKGTGESQELYFTTNVGDVVRVDDAHRIKVETDPDTLEPLPLLSVRGRLQALISRPCFYQLVEWAEERNGVLGIQSAGTFFPLGPKGVHEVDA